MIHLCCGSAGTYNMLQPEIAGRLRARKLENLALYPPRPDRVGQHRLHYPAFRAGIPGGCTPSSCSRGGPEEPEPAGLPRH